MSEGYDSAISTSLLQVFGYLRIREIEIKKLANERRQMNTKIYLLEQVKNTAQKLIDATKPKARKEIKESLVKALSNCKK